MLKSREIFTIQTSIDNLANKFTELENSYYGFLLRSQEENQNTIKNEPEVNSEFFQNLLKEQNYLQNNVKHLTSLEVAYNEELKHLRNLLLNLKEEQPSVSNENIKELQSIVEQSITSLFENIILLDEIKSLENNTTDQVQKLFEDTLQGVEQAFAEFPHMTRNTVEDFVSLNKLEEICNVNLGISSNLEFDLESFKSALSGSLKTVNKLTSEYTKETQSLQANMERSKTEVGNLVKGIKNFKKQQTEETLRGLNDSFNVLNHELDEVSSHDVKKNELFVKTRGQIEDIMKTVKHYIKDNKKHFDSIKINSEGIKSLAEVIRTKVNTVPATTPNVGDYEEHKGDEILMSPAFANRRQDEEQLLRSDSPRQQSAKDIFRETVPDSKSSRDTERIKAHLKNIREHFDGCVYNLSQRLSNVKLSSKRLNLASGKIAKLARKKGIDDESLFKEYENEKRVHENYMNILEETLVKTKEQLEKTKKTKHNNGSSKKQVASALVPERSNQRDVENKKSASGHKREHAQVKIKAMIDEFERKHGDVLKSRSPDVMSDNREMPHFLSSDGFKKSTPASAVDKEQVNQLKSMEFDLLIMKKRCEELTKERDRLKKEIGEGKKHTSSSELLPKFAELSEQSEKLTKENAKLVKVAKKMELKANERKNALKKLYELLQEKEKELNFMKENNLKSIQERGSVDQDDIGKKWEEFQKVIQEKEAAIAHLEETVTKLSSSIASKRDTETRERHSIRTGESERKRGGKDELTPLEKKKKQIYDLVSQINVYPSSKSGERHQEESKEFGEKQKNSRISAYDHFDVSRDSRDTLQDKRSSKLGLRDQEDFVEKLRAQSIQLNDLEVQKNDLEIRCADLVSELETAQELRKKMERNHQEEIQVWNNKVQQLSLHIEEMEIKNNEKFRDSLQGDKWKRPASSGRESTPKKADTERKERRDLELFERKLDEAAERFEFGEGEYEDYDVFGKLEKVLLTWAEVEQGYLQKLEEADLIITSLEKNQGQSEIAASLQEELHESNRNIQTLNAALNEKEKDIEAILVDLKKKVDENETIITEYKNLEEIAKRIEADYQNFVENLANLLANYGVPIDTNETEIARFSEQLYEIIESVLDSVAKQKEEETGEELRQKELLIEEFEKQNKEQQEEIGKLKDQLKDKVAELEEMEKVLKEHEAKHSESKSKLSKNMDEMNSRFWKETEQYNQKIQTLKNKLGQGKEQIQALTTEVSQLKEENQRIAEAKAQIEEEFNTKSVEMMTLQQELENAQKQRKRSEDDQVLDVKNRLAEKEEALEELQKEKGTLEEELERVYNEVGEFEKQFENLKDEKIGLEKELEEAREENDALTKQIFEMENDMLQSKVEDNNTQRENEELVSDLKQQLQRVSKEAESEKAKALELAKELSETKEEKSTLEHSYKEKEKTLQLFESSLKTIEGRQEELERQIAQKNEEIERLRSGADQISELEQMLQERDQVIEENNLKIEELTGAIQQLQDEMSQLEQNLNDASEQLEQAGLKINELTDENSQLEEKILELEDLIGEKEKEIEELKQGYAASMNDIDEVKGAREKEVENAKAEILALQIAKEKLETANEELNGLLSQLQKEHEDKIQENMKAADEELEKLNERIESLEKLNQEYEQQIVDFEKEKQLIESQVAEKEESLQNLQTMEHKIAQYEHELHQYREVEENLTKELKEYKILHEELDKDREELKSELVRLQEIVDEAEEDKKEKVMLKEKLHTMQFTIQESQAKAIQEALKIESLEQEILRISQEKEEMNLQEGVKGKLVQSRIQELDDKVTQKSIALEFLQKQHETKVEELEREIKAYQEDNEKLQEDLKILQEENQSSVDYLIELEAKIERLEAEIQTEKEEKQGLEEMVTEYETRINEDEVQLVKLQKDIEILESEKLALGEKVEKLERKRDDELGENSQVVKELETKVEELEKKLKLKSDILEEIKSEYEGRIKELEDEIHTYKEEKVVLEAELKDFEDEKQTHTETNLENENKIEQLEREILQLKGELEDKNQEILHSEGVVAELKEEILKHEAGLKELQQEKEVWIKEKTSLENQLVELQQNEETLENLNLQREESNQVIRDLESKIGGLEQEQEKIQVLTVTLEKKEKENAELTHQISQYEDDMKLLQQTIDDLNLQLDDLTREKIEIKEQLVQINEELKDLNEQKEQAETEANQNREALELEVAKATELASSLQAELKNKEKEYLDELARIQEGTEELQNIQEKNSKYETLLAEYEERITKLEEDLKTSNLEEMTLKEENKQLNAEVEGLRDEIDLREQQYNVNMQALRNGVAEIKMIIAAKEEELAAKDAELKELKQKFAMSESQLESDLRKQEHTPNKHSKGGFEAFGTQDFGEFNDQFDQFEDFDDSVNHEFKREKTPTIKEMKELKELREMKVELENMNSELQRHVQELQENEALLKDQVEHLTNQIRSQDSQRKGIMNSDESLTPEEKIEILENELREMNAIMAMRNNEIVRMRTGTQGEINEIKEEYEDQIAELNQNFQALQERNGEILVELETTQSQYGLLKKAYDDLKARSEQLPAESPLKKGQSLTVPLVKGLSGERSPTFDLSPEGKKDVLAELNFNDPEQIKLKIADYERKFEKLRVDRRGLKESNLNLKEENNELRKTMKMFQEQIVTLNQQGSGQEMTSGKSQKMSDEAADALREGFKSFETFNSLRGKLSLNTGDRNEVKKNMDIIKGYIENNEKEINHLQSESQKRFAVNELENQIQALQEAIAMKLNMIQKETEGIILGMGLDVPAVSYEIKTRKDLEEDEKIIYTCLHAIKVLLLESRRKKEPSPRKGSADFGRRIPEPKKLSLQIKPLAYDETSLEKEKEFEDSQEHDFEHGDRGSHQRGDSNNLPDEADEAKARSLLEGTFGDVGESLSPQNEKEHIQYLYEQRRKLQDENDRLESECRQLKNDYEILKFVNEDLKADVADKDERIRKLLESMLNDPKTNQSNKFDEEKARHEKEHLKKIFLTFLDSAIQGNKDAEDLFKVLLTLLEIPEPDKTNFINNFKAKAAASKKGMFGKIFK